MALGDAHQGYSYQDLLCTYYILESVVKGQESDFLIDYKEYSEDRFDDLTIRNDAGTFKKQIKYSNESNDHKLKKDDIANDGNYQLALHSLFASWKADEGSNIHCRLCLAWNQPDDTLADLMKFVNAGGSFKSFPTTVLKLDIDRFWPVGKEPVSGWTKFRSMKLDREEFAKFIDHLSFELELPKFSEDLYNPGVLEKLTLELADNLGIGYFPNSHWNKQEFVSALMAKVRKHRSSSRMFSTYDIYNHFGIKKDYGAIEQEFPVVESQNIQTNEIYQLVVSQLQQNQRVSITGGPGMGKSWLVENLRNYIKNTEVHLIRHLCYTDLNDFYQKERIQLNVFYGNLIKQILEIFPLLKELKERSYASNLDELNILIGAIAEETILVIDGLDHVDRVYEMYNLASDITRSEIDILGAIKKLKPSEFVRILVIAQPIKELLVLQDFTQMQFPSWATAQVLDYMGKNSLEDVAISEEKSLSDYLKAKSSGNPLYMRYIVKEILQLDHIEMKKLDLIPVYDTGLATYYQYLIAKLNLGEQVPRILAGVSFTLTSEEIGEITGDGEFVETALDMLMPVLRLDVSQNGYSIYHDSFRRFVFEQLKEKKISIEKNVFTGRLIYRSHNQYISKCLFAFFKSSKEFTVIHLIVITTVTGFVSFWASIT